MSPNRSEHLTPASPLPARLTSETTVNRAYLLKLEGLVTLGCSEPVFALSAFPASSITVLNSHWLIRLRLSQLRPSLLR